MATSGLSSLGLDGQRGSTGRYPLAVMPLTPDVWPDSGLAPIAELAGNPGRSRLVVGGSSGRHTLQPLAEALKLDIVSAGRVLARPAMPATADTVRDLSRALRPRAQALRRTIQTDGRHSRRFSDQLAVCEHTAR